MIGARDVHSRSGQVMLLSVDVHYGDLAVVTACVGFSEWSDPSSMLELVVRSESVPAPYQPGQFYRRELSHIASALGRLHLHPPTDAVIIDGHVWLDAGKPGLGAHLHDTLGGRIAVVGVAKSAFRGGVAVPVLRGRSRLPLFVSAAGMDPARAADLVRRMHGPHRIPTLLKRTDQLARGHERPDPAKAIDTLS